MRVLKFGGSSLADAERFNRAASIILDKASAGRVAVVLSAPGGVTNSLVSAIEKTVNGVDAVPAVSNIENTFRTMISTLQSDYPPLDELEESFKAYSELGVKIMVTEMDVTVVPFPTNDFRLLIADC